MSDVHILSYFFAVYVLTYGAERDDTLGDQVSAEAHIRTLLRIRIYQGEGWLHQGQRKQDIEGGYTHHAE